jgi:type I restriction enzyme S subunit
MTGDQRQRLGESDQVSFVPMEAVGENGGLRLDIIKDKEAVEKGYTLFFDGDVIVAKITPCFENFKGALAADLHNGVAFGTTELHVLSPNNGLDGRFLFYLTMSHQFRIQGEAAMKGAAGQKRVPDEFIQNFRFAVPSLKEQKLIADYLDSQLARLRVLLGDKERMLALLKERRVAFASRAVSRGLNSRARMKHSGQAWLGEIPAHWEVKRTKRVFSERDDRSETGDEEMLTVSHITGVTKRSEKDVNMFEAETNEGYKICSPGNLVINTLWAWMGAMGISPEEGIVSPAYHVYELSDEILPGYVDAMVRTPAFTKEVTRFSTGVWSSRLRLYPEGLYEVRVPVPPLDDQEAIVAAIAHEGAHADEFEMSLQRSINLLNERRAALISAAVTGEIPTKAMIK